MKKRTITRLPESICLKCGYHMTAATAVKGAATPSTDDYTLCLNCGALHRFNADGTLRPGTAADVAELEPETARELGRATGILLRRGPFEKHGKRIPLRRGEN